METNRHFTRSRQADDPKSLEVDQKSSHLAGGFSKVKRKRSKSPSEGKESRSKAPRSGAKSEGSDGKRASDIKEASRSTSSSAVTAASSASPLIIPLKYRDIAAGMEEEKLESSPAPSDSIPAHLECKQCCYRFQDVPGLRDHLLQAHSQLFVHIPGLQCGVKQFECQFCDIFRSKGKSLGI